MALRYLARRHRGALIGMLAQAFQYGASLLLLPFIVTRLSPAEVGVWYVFVTVQSLALLSDFGFQPTVARAFAAAFAGAPELRSEGLAVQGEEGLPNYVLAATILRAARRLYFWLAAMSLAGLLSIGLVYVTYVAAGEVANLHRVQLAWVVFAVGTAAYLYLTWVSPFLLGSGLIEQNYFYLIVSRGGFAVLAILALIAGGGLIALAAANVFANLLARGVAGLLMRPAMRSLRGQRVAHGASGEVLRALWPNAGRMGLVALSGFLITRASVLILSGFDGLAASASYAISLQILTAMGMVAMLPTQIMLPRIVELRVRDDLPALRHLLFGRILFFFLSFIAGALLFVLFGQPAFHLIGSHIALLSWPILSLLAFVILLESNHSNFAFVITTGNRVPFVLPSIASAAAIVLGCVLAAWAGAGALGVIVAQGVVQAAYNNWKWPLLAWKDLHRDRV